LAIVAKAIYALMALVILLAVATLLFSTFSCYPVRYFWDLAVPGGKCLDREALYLGIGSINIATDLLILVLPTFMLKDLTIPKLQKMFLIVITSLGGT
jgi:hypothetical protein